MTEFRSRRTMTRLEQWDGRTGVGPAGIRPGARRDRAARDHPCRVRGGALGWSRGGAACRFSRCDLVVAEASTEPTRSPGCRWNAREKPRRTAGSPLDTSPVRSSSPSIRTRAPRAGRGRVRPRWAPRARGRVHRVPPDARARGVAHGTCRGRGWRARPADPTRRACATRDPSAHGSRRRPRIAGGST